MELTVDIGMKYPRITGPMADAFAAELEKLVESTEFTNLMLDFQGTQMLSSTAIASLFSAHRKLAGQNRELRIINVSERVHHLLSMVDLADILL